MATVVVNALVPFPLFFPEDRIKGDPIVICWKCFIFSRTYTKFIRWKSEIICVKMCWLRKVPWSRCYWSLHIIPSTACKFYYILFSSAIYIMLQYDWVWELGIKVAIGWKQKKKEKLYLLKRKVVSIPPETARFVQEFVNDCELISTSLDKFKIDYQVLKWKLLTVISIDYSNRRQTVCWQILSQLHTPYS